MFGRLFLGLSWEATDPHPSIPTQSWSLNRDTPYFPLQKGSHGRKAVQFATKKTDAREEKKRGILFYTSSACVFLPRGLQFWLCVGNKQRGPKCLKQITCCRCLGVTSRCVALFYLRRCSGYLTSSHCISLVYSLYLPYLIIYSCLM